MANVIRNSFKLYINNLPWTIGEKDLQKYFSKFGHVSNATVVFNREKGLSKGYGFVTFTNKDAYNSACNQRIHFLDGRVLKVSPANS